MANARAGEGFLMPLKISIFGLGYVGAVSGACLARHGHEILGVDKNPCRVALLAAGHSPIVEAGLDDLIARMAGEGRLCATTDPDRAVHETDVSLVSVGTPSERDGSLSLHAVEAVTRE